MEGPQGRTVTRRLQDAAPGDILLSVGGAVSWAALVLSVGRRAVQPPTQQREETVAEVLLHFLSLSSPPRLADMVLDSYLGGYALLLARHPLTGDIP